MPTFEFTSPEGKKYSVSGPEGATKEQAFQILQQQMAGGTAKPDAPAPSHAGIPEALPGSAARLAASNDAISAQGPKPDPTFVDKLIGGGETALSLATGATGGALGMLGGAAAGLVGNLTNGRFGMKDGVEQGMQQGAESLTYSPRTELGQEYTGAVGDVLANTLPALPMTAEMSLIGKGAKTASSAAASTARSSVATLAKYADETNAARNAADAALRAAPKSKLGDLLRTPTAETMPGVGAASTAKAAVRADRFERLGIKPTLGQLTRDKQQQKFEREIAKQPEGKALDDHFAEQNQQVYNKLNDFADETGAQSRDLRDVGMSTVDALAEKSAFQKNNIRDAYKAARDAGEMAEPVDVTNLATFVKANKGKDKLAPIVSMIESELKQNATESGGGLDKLTLTPTPKRTMMTLDASEDLRQAINKLAEPGTPNVVMGKDAIRLIDKATKDSGGALFQQARRMYENHMNEFGNRDVIDKVLRTKPGTNDRAVALEDVFKHTILDPKGKDDISHVFRVLEAHPVGTPLSVVEAGQQAAKDLRGALVSHIQDKMFSNGGADASGNVVGSQAQIKKLISEMDRKGKLQAVFGKDGAQQLRDLSDAAVDIYTSPSGVINTSNNAPAIVGAIEKFGKSPVRVIPGAGFVSKQAAEYVREKHTAKLVKKALEPEKTLKQQKNKF